MQTDSQTASEPQVRCMEWLEDAEQLARELEAKVFELDRRRQALRAEADNIDKIHGWLNDQRHKAAKMVERMKAKSSNEKAEL